MKIEDKFKSKVIWTIDSQMEKVRGTIWERELGMMRKKYIYKDIEGVEFKRDLKFLKCIIKL